MNKLMFRIVLFFLITGISAVQASPEKIKIINTIKPIQLIVSDIAADNAELIQLIPDYTSAHDYTFKPADIRKIKQADVVFRIDEHLESVLSSVLELNVAKDKLISLAEIDDITLLKLESVRHSHSHKMAKKGGGVLLDKEYEENIDLHIWSSPENSLAMAKAIAFKLSAIDPNNAKIYQDNLVLFKGKLLKANRNIQTILLNVKDKPYIVFHDSWHYFAEYFGLKKPVIISFHEELGGDIKSILDTREKIKSDGITCVFSDLAIRPARVKTISENIKLKTVQVDVLASEIVIDTSTKNSAYVNWLEGMANKIHNCLK